MRLGLQQIYNEQQFKANRLGCQWGYHRVLLCVLLPLENLLWAKLRDYTVSRVNPNPRPAFLAQTPGPDLPVSGRTEVPPGSGLPLNRILYIPFRIFAYSSNIVIANLVRIESILVEGTLEYSRFSLNSVSFRDHVPVTMSVALALSINNKQHPCLDRALAHHTCGFLTC
jgi:hypothetical protein